MKYSESLQRATTRRDGPPVTRWSDEEFRDQRDLDLQTETISTRQVLVAVSLCLLTAALLTSGTLVEAAQRRNFGTERDTLLAGAEPLDRVANFLSLNRPADLIADIREATPPASDASVPVDAAPEPRDGGAVIGATPQPNIADSAPAVGTPPEPLRIVTSNDPLRVLVAGDSQAEYPGQALTNRAVNGKLDYEVSVDSRIATGLARPDYFDWRNELASVSVEVEAAVLFFGGNDYQDMEANGERVVRGTDAWFDEYARRMASVADVLQQDGRQVFWVAAPPVRDGETTAALQTMNELLHTIASTRPWLRVVDSSLVLAPDGTFRVYLPDDDGVDVRVRSGDGVHVTSTGASWLADLLVEEMAVYWTMR